MKIYTTLEEVIKALQNGETIPSKQISPILQFGELDSFLFKHHLVFWDGDDLKKMPAFDDHYPVPVKVE